MWELEIGDYCYLEAENFFFPYSYEPHAPPALEPILQIPKEKQTKQTVKTSPRTSQSQVKTIKKLRKRIKDLQAQLKQLKQSKKRDCCDIMSDQRKNSLISECQNTRLICQMETPCPENLQFEQFQIIKQPMTPTHEAEMNGQSWILTGMMMLVMGININGYQQSVLDIYKLTKESVFEVRNQIQNCLNQITLPIFYSKMFSDIPQTDGAAAPTPNGMESLGIKLDVVNQDTLMFQEQISYKFKYEALNMIAEMMKECVLFY